MAELANCWETQRRMMMRRETNVRQRSLKLNNHHLCHLFYFVSPTPFPCTVDCIVQQTTITHE